MLYAIAAVLVLIADQAVKYWATTSIALDTGSKAFIPGVISLVNIHNSGAAFGFLQNANARWLFVLIAAVFVALVVFALARNIVRSPLGRWSAVLVMAGAVGNCIDRVMSGYVVDMFKLDFMNFAVFNVADIFITVCGILFCVYIIFGDDFKQERAPAGDSPKKPARERSRKLPPDAGHAAPRPAPAESRRAPSPRPKAEPDDEGVRTYKPRAASAAPEKAAPRPEPVRREPPAEKPRPAEKPAPAKPDDPFAEWDSIPSPTAKKQSPAAEKSGSPAQRPAPIPTPAPAKTTEPEGEFSLEDILAEYSGK